MIRTKLFQSENMGTKGVNDVDSQINTFLEENRNCGYVDVKVGAYTEEDGSFYRHYALLVYDEY
ncbi:sporulation protein Cse60 [Priestia aryabhattai]|uniref:sporulation protein Cse60 n=1 Tax=Priestia aryabhattai TaxID=412384 RepID=UPI003531840D